MFFDGRVNYCLQTVLAAVKEQRMENNKIKRSMLMVEQRKVVVEEREGQVLQLLSLIKGERNNDVFANNILNNILDQEALSLTLHFEYISPFII